MVVYTCRQLWCLGLGGIVAEVIGKHLEVTRVRVVFAVGHRIKSTYSRDSSLLPAPYHRVC